MAKKKDDKAKKAEKKARKDAKQSKKADKKDKKVKAKGADSDDDADADLDAILQEYAKQQEQFLKVTEVPSPPPTARSSATLASSPETKEIFLFGGEHYNGALVTFFSDLYIYLLTKGTWRRVTSPNSPLPRSGHAMCRATNGLLYLSMGEFSSPKQGTFHHYNDLWQLDPASREWTRLEPKGKTPPARSGHRMVAYKEYILLFGGFQDTSQQTKYLQDLWIYDVRAFVWHNPLPTQKPDPRSSFTFLPHDAGAALFGGYSRVKTTTKAGNQAKGGGGGGQATRNVLKPMVHQDSWLLRITPPDKEAAAKTPPAAVWERRKKPANAPNPARAGATMVYHKGRGIMFGGVHDVEQSEEGIESEFFNNLFAWNVDRNRFFPLTLRKPRGGGGGGQQGKKAQERGGAGGRRARGKADEEELLRNLAALNATGSVEGAAAVAGVAGAGAGAGAGEANDSDSDSSEDHDPLRDQPVTTELPHTRFNAQLAVHGDTLYVYGGTYEAGEREFTFDEMHAIDLGKLDGVRQIFRRELEDWVGEDDDDDDDDDDDEEDEDEEDEDGDGEEEEETTSQTPTAVGSTDTPLTPSTLAPSTPTAGTTTAAVAVADEDQEEEPSTLTPSADDGKPYPRPFESLRDFFTRTSTTWQELLLQQTRDGAVARSVKEVRKAAFALAEGRWWDVREEVGALEEQQESAGIAEVVSLAERGDAGAGGGVGRRR